MLVGLAYSLWNGVTMHYDEAVGLVGREGAGGVPIPFLSKTKTTVIYKEGHAACAIDCQNVLEPVHKKFKYLLREKSDS